MSKSEQIKQHCKQLKLSALSEHLDEAIAEAESKGDSYLELVRSLLETEARHRQYKADQRQLKLPNNDNYFSPVASCSFLLWFVLLFSILR